MAFIIDAIYAGRTHIDEMFKAPLTECQSKMATVLSVQAGWGNLNKAAVVDLTTTVQKNIKSGQNTALAVAVTCYVISHFAPFFTTTLTVAAIGSAIIAFDMSQLHHAAFQIKTWLANDASDSVSKGSFQSQLKRARAALQQNTFFLSLLYGPEVDEFPNFMGRMISAGSVNVPWVPETDTNPLSFSEYLGSIQTKVGTALRNGPGQVGAGELQEVVATILRPLVLGRAVCGVFALGFYLAASYLPIFSSLLFIQACASAFFAWEFHQFHDSVRMEIGDWTIDHWGKNLPTSDLVNRVNNCMMIIQESSFVFYRKFVFKSEIDGFPDYVDSLIQASGDLAQVEWPKNSTLETILGLIKTMKAFTPSMVAKMFSGG